MSTNPIGGKPKPCANCAGAGARLDQLQSRVAEHEKHLHTLAIAGFCTAIACIFLSIYSTRKG